MKMKKLRNALTDVNKKCIIPGRTLNDYQTANLVQKNTMASFWGIKVRRRSFYVPINC